MNMLNRIKNWWEDTFIDIPVPVPVVQCTATNQEAVTDTYSDKMLYIIELYNGASYDEIQEEFNEIFDIELKRPTMRGLMSRMKCAGIVYKQDDVWYLT